MSVVRRSQFPYLGEEEQFRLLGFGDLKTAMTHLTSALNNHATSLACLVVNQLDDPEDGGVLVLPMCQLSIKNC